MLLYLHMWNELYLYLYLFIRPKDEQHKVWKEVRIIAVADPGLLRGGRKGMRQSIIRPIFPKNCMKLKKIGPEGGGCPKFVCVSATTLADPWGIINRRSLPQATSFHFHAVFGIDALTFGAVAPVWEILDPPLHKNCLYWFSPVMLNFKWSNFFYKLKFEQVSCFSTK